MPLEALSKRLIRNRRRTAVEGALALQRRGEARSDGLRLVSASHMLEIQWRARDIHPWDRGRPRGRAEHLFHEQCYADTEAAVARLFDALPEVDAICFRVLQPDSDEELLAGLVTRGAMDGRDLGATPRTRLWQMGIRF